MKVNVPAWAPTTPPDMGASMNMPCPRRVNGTGHITGGHGIDGRAVDEEPFLVRQRHVVEKSCWLKHLLEDALHVPRLGQRSYYRFLRRVSPYRYQLLSW